MQPTYNTRSTPAKIEFNTLQSEAIMEQERIDEFYRRANMQTIKMDTARIYNKKTGQETIHVYALAYMDSASDTCGIGGEAWIIDCVTERKDQVIGYHKTDTAMNHIKIGGGITAVDLPNKTTVLIRVGEATLLGKDANILFSVAQMRDHGVYIDDVLKKHGGQSYMQVEGTVIPLFMCEGMICMNIRKPPEKEMEECELIDITTIMPWNPHILSDEQSTMEEAEYAELLGVSDERKMNMKMKKQEHVKQHPEEIALFFFHPKEKVLEKTLECTTQFGTIHGHFPMQIHHKSRNPILQRRRINEEYATDSWFSTVTSYEGYNGAQGFYGIKSKYMSHNGFKQNQKDQIAYWISSERKEFQYPS